MTRLSDKEIAGAVRDAGFPPRSWAIAVAVALAESSGETTATHTNSDGSTDYGLFQINSVHSDLLANHTWADPTDNARMALAISSNGTNWHPWTTYNSSAYRVYLPRAERATGKPATPPSGGGSGQSFGVTPAGFPNPLKIAGDFWNLISNPDTWKRLLLVIAGAGLLWIGLQRLTTIDNVLRDAGTQAAEIAAVA